jgi:WD40 repeat protein
LNASTLVTGGSDGSVRVWSLQTYQPIHRLAAHDNSVTSLQFDTARIVSGGSDGHVKVWDLHTGVLVRELGAPADQVWRVVFEREKAVVLSQRGGRTVMEVWDFAPPADDTDLDTDLDSPRRQAPSPASEPDQSLLDAYGAASVADDLFKAGGSGSAPPSSAAIAGPSRESMRLSSGRFGSSDMPRTIYAHASRAGGSLDLSSSSRRSTASTSPGPDEDVRMEE